MLVMTKLLSQINYVGHDKHVFAATNICRNKHNFVTTDMSFVMTKEYLSCPNFRCDKNYVCHNKTFVVTKYFCHDKTFVATSILLS